MSTNYKHISILALSVCLFLQVGYSTVLWEDIEDFAHIQKILSKPRKLDHEKDSAQDVYKNIASDVTVKSFSWSSCSQSSDPTTVKSITISPDPLSLPGNITIGVESSLKIPLKAPLSLDLNIKKKVVFWIPIPCVDNVGSCNYDDICQLLPKLGCPEPFKKYGIPCSCPVKPGTYKLPPSSFYVNPVGVPSWLEGGDYKATAKLYQGSQEIVCINIELSVKG